ncbi:MAG: type III-B CRISPR-associated protein Cas10/Cmr2 [Chloroflexota bacterium]
MPDTLLIFTFSPIQSFIVEARRAQDLFMGSRILSQLAKAAGNAIIKEIGDENLVYPADLSNDTPNVLVACIPDDRVLSTVESAEAEMKKAWEKYVSVAWVSISGFSIPSDDMWNEIWKRQTKPFWQVFWASAPMVGGDYRTAYKTARDWLNTVKRSRLFDSEQPEEGRKDSLSGKRTALHTKNFSDARKYWVHVTSTTNLFASKVRPAGREMLDAIGAVKRFSSNETFLSTSSIAAAEYLVRVQRNAYKALCDYRDEIRKQFVEGNNIFEPGQKAYDWPYDGDLLYKETLTAKRLKDDYGVIADEEKLKSCRKYQEAVYDSPLLENPHKKLGEPPKYYALLALDGDGMGARIDSLLELPDPKSAHKKFSEGIGKFALQTPSTVTREFLIYNGGDDVLCMLPLVYAIPFAQKLAEQFLELTGNTASAGIAIIHHQSPLDAALEAARSAEQAAKRIDDNKNAVCVRVFRFRTCETD